jgi:predicted transglutaminase-like cysteine proteinase
MRQALFGRYDSCASGSLGAALHRLARVGAVGATFLLAGATQAQTTASLPNPSQPIERTGSAKPVAAWVDMCRRMPAECEVDVNEPASIELTSETWRTIVAVNRRVNARIRPITDKAHFGVVDRWDYPDDGSGDCEDYQLLKRRLLIERGLPRRAMRMTVVIDDQGEGHAVLMIRTDRGDYILDNKVNAVLPWHQTGYIYVKREGQDGLTWVSLGNVTSPVQTANR